MATNAQKRKIYQKGGLDSLESNGSFSTICNSCCCFISLLVAGFFPLHLFLLLSARFRKRAREREREGHKSRPELLNVRYFSCACAFLIWKSFIVYIFISSSESPFLCSRRARQYRIELKPLRSVRREYLIYLKLNHSN